MRSIGLHLAATAVVAVAFAWRFGHNPRSIAAHTLLLAEWDLLLVGLSSVIAAFSAPASVWPRRTVRVLIAATTTLQVYLYALNVISNVAWGRNMTGHLVSAFGPTVLSGREPFPVGPLGIAAFAGGTLLLMLAAATRWSPVVERRSKVRPGGRLETGHALRRGWRPVAVATTALLFSVTMAQGIAGRDNLFWKQELISSFFRPEGFAFEPTPRRLAVAERDAELRAAYPRHVPAARRAHVILIIVDSLRADRMQVYGYHRPTTPFLSELVAARSMQKVDAAFSSCSESFCGITSTLASREFRSISARTFQLQDVLRDQGYQTRFLLSGNHRAWNGLTAFYHAEDETLFDGTQTERYTMDDDRLVLEGLERVPAASADRPTFFYVHLMSPHYLGVQFEQSHVFTPPDDRVSPGLEPFKIVPALNKPDRYDDKVLQADGVIRQIFEALKAKHYLDDAMVVVTGDHGEGLGERHWAHGWHLYEEDIRIPLLLFDTAGARYPDLAFATQIDIAPTILDRLRLPIPASWDGQSLLAPAATRITHHQTYFLPNRFAVLYRDGDTLFKFIATPKDGREELYDLRADRAEAHSLVNERPELASRLRDETRRYRSDEP